MIHEGRRTLERTTVRIKMTKGKIEEHREELGKRMKILEGDLDASERIDPELIGEYFNDAPVIFGERELKTANE